MRRHTMKNYLLYTTQRFKTKSKSPIEPLHHNTLTTEHSAKDHDLLGYVT